MNAQKQKMLNLTSNQLINTVIKFHYIYNIGKTFKIWKYQLLIRKCGNEDTYNAGIHLL